MSNISVDIQPVTPEIDPDKPMPYRAKVLSHYAEKHMIWVENWRRVTNAIAPHVKVDADGNAFLDPKTTPKKLAKRFKKLVVEGIMQGYMEEEERGNES